MTEDYRSIITQEPGKRGGRPCIRGMRIAVADILGWLAAGMSHDEIIADYPELTEADIRGPGLCRRPRAPDRDRFGVKPLFDQNLSHRLCRLLADVFPEAAQVRRARLDRADHNAIWEFARREGFAIVTLEADFATSQRSAGRRPGHLAALRQPTDDRCRAIVAGSC